jgi:hypothetical protein
MAFQLPAGSTYEKQKQSIPGFIADLKQAQVSKPR